MTAVLWGAPARLYVPGLPEEWHALELPSFRKTRGDLSTYRAWLVEEIAGIGPVALAGHSMGGALSLLAAWLLLAHWVDLYWLVMPHLHADGPRPWLFDLTAFAGVGGAAVAFTVLRMRGTAPVPVSDPYLEDSLRYLPP